MTGTLWLKDAATENERKLEDAARLVDEVRVSLLTLGPYADVLKLTHEDWLTSSHPDADATRRIVQMLGAMEQPAPAPPSTMTIREAAERLNRAKPNGDPRDSFYRDVLPLIGTQTGPRGWIVHVAKVEAFERGELA